MLNVRNKKTIRSLSFQAFRANKTRNIIGVIAIALTTILFTVLFTVLITTNYSFEQQTMRRAGNYAHGTYSELDKEQADQLKKHALIQQYGESYAFSFPQQEPFHKSPVEIRYADDNYAKFTFASPTTGRMPVGEKEIAASTAALNLLGVPAHLGEEVILTYPIGDKMVTDIFTLCGYWEQEKAFDTYSIWLSKEYTISNMEKISAEDRGACGVWNLNVLFQDSKQIEEKLHTIAAGNGYTIDDSTAKNDINAKMNWAYTVNFAEDTEPLQVLIMVGVVLLTGYLIIHNVFQISIVGDIKFYGLLKTIGTTGRQIKRMIRYQIMLLSVIGMPIGLIIGYGLGNSLSKIIMSTMTMTTTYLTLNIWIFIGAALFAFSTVIISCHKPGKMAGSVSPIEAIRYTENGTKAYKKGGKGNKILSMVGANLMRNRKKTVLVILSLTLSIVLLNTAYSITKGYDGDHYLKELLVTDFMVGDTALFKSKFNFSGDKEGSGRQESVPEGVIEAINKQEGVEETGRVNFYVGHSESKFVTKTQWLEQNYLTEEDINNLPEEDLPVGIREMKGDEPVPEPISVYGLDELPISYLELIDGTLDTVISKNPQSIIQVVKETYDAKLNIGDKMTISYNDIGEDGKRIQGKSYEKEYEVVATVVMPYAMTTRWSWGSEFILSSEVLEQDVKEDSVTMSYLINTKEENISELETFLQYYTENVDSNLAYESKSEFDMEFKSTQRVDMLVGSIVCLIIGLIAILNFVNAEITSIIAGKRELAMLQSIGMTGKQVKQMLIIEGLTYGLAAVFLAAILNVFIYVFLMDSIVPSYWFFKKEFTMGMIWMIIPILIFLGIIIPLIVFKNISKESTVERLRDGMLL